MTKIRMIGGSATVGMLVGLLFVSAGCDGDDPNRTKPTRDKDLAKDDSIRIKDSSRVLPTKDKDIKRVEKTNVDPEMYDQAAVLAAIDDAIAKGVGPKPKLALGKMRKCISGQGLELDLEGDRKSVV